MADPKIPDNWGRGAPYERYVGRWSRRVAPLFLSWLAVPPGRRWLDVGCGTGALSVTIVDDCAPAQVIGVEPAAGFLQAARENLGERAQLHQGNAAAIPLHDASVDVTVSALVLNFVPDAPAAMAEMKRVTAAGGTIAAYVWDYAGGMELMRHFWDAAGALDPAVGNLDEALRFPLCRPDPLRELFSSAGLRDVDVTAIDIPTPFENFDDYWQPFLGGQGSAPSYVASLSEEAKTRLREALRSRITPAGDGPIAMTARAWAVRGTR